MKRILFAMAMLGAGMSGAAAQNTSVPTVTNDPLGASTEATTTPGSSDLIDNTPTSSIQEVNPPIGMAPLIVPNDPLGTSVEPQFHSDVSSPAVSSPSVGIK